MGTSYTIFNYFGCSDLKTSEQLLKFKKNIFLFFFISILWLFLASFTQLKRNGKEIIGQFEYLTFFRARAQSKINFKAAKSNPQKSVRSEEREISNTNTQVKSHFGGGEGGGGGLDWIDWQQRSNG